MERNRHFRPIGLLIIVLTAFGQLGCSAGGVEQKTVQEQAVMTPPMGLPEAPSAATDFVGILPGERFFELGEVPFIPIGHNDWASPVLLLDPERIDRYLRHMREHGENVLRMILDDRDALIELSPGEFNPAAIEAIDNLVGSAERHGIFLILALFPNLYDASGGNWHTHPYNRAFDPNDGLVGSPEDILTDPAAREAGKRRIRFCIERWGRNKCILAWELWNELNAIGSLEDQNGWIEDVGPYAKNIESGRYGRRHLLTASSNNAGWADSASALYDSDALDFTSYHTYDALLRVGINPYDGFPGFSTFEAVNYFRFVNRSARVAREKSPARPVLDTEDVGIVIDSRFLPWPYDLFFEGYSTDQQDDFFIGSAWASFLGGSAGPGLRWPCNPGFDDDSEDGYRALSAGMYKGQKALSQILSRIDWAKHAMVASDDAVVPGAGTQTPVFPLALTDGSITLAILIHDDEEFSGDTVQTTVTFHFDSGAPSAVTWFDPRTGEILDAQGGSGPALRVSTPPFKRFVVALANQ